MKFKKTKIAKSLPLFFAFLAFAIGIGVRSADASGVYAEDSSEPALTSQGNAYVSLDSGAMVLHMKGDTDFKLNAGNQTFYNGIGVGASSDPYVYISSNYSFKYGNDNLYVVVGNNVYSGYSLHFQLYYSMYQGGGYQLCRARWYVASSSDTTMHVISQSESPVTCSVDPAPNELLTFNMVYVGGFDGNVRVLTNVNQDVTDMEKGLEIIQNWSTFVIYAPSGGDGSITREKVTYSLFNYATLISDGYTPYYQEFDIATLAVPVEVDGGIYGTSSYDFDVVVFPYSVVYEIDQQENATLKKLSFVSVHARVFELQQYDWFWQLPIAIGWYTVGGQFELVGSPSYVPHAIINQTDDVYVSGVSWAGVSSTYGYGFTYSVNTPPTTYLKYQFSRSMLNRFFYHPAVDVQWKQYMQGWDDGRANLVSGLVNGTAYEQGYADGKRAGYDEGFSAGQNDKHSTVFSLFGAVTSVPINIINGLSPLVIWDTPIISIVLTFLFVGVLVFIVKRFI